MRTAPTRLGPASSSHLSLLFCQRISEVNLAFASKAVAQEFFHYRHPLDVVERSPAMCRAVDNLELNRGAHSFISATKFMRLVDGHLRILITVQQKKGRIVSIHMEYGTGQPGERRKRVGLAAEQNIWFIGERRITTSGQLARSPAPTHRTRIRERVAMVHGAQSVQALRCRGRIPGEPVTVS